MPTKLDLRQSVLRPALPMVGSAAGDAADTILPKIDAELAKLFEDRNVLLTDGGLITFTGTDVQFTEDLKIEINSQIAGGTPTIINLGQATLTVSVDGRMIYAAIDRLAGTAVVTDDAATLPAVTSANQEVFLIAKRVDAADGTQRLYFRNGSTLNAGQSARLGSTGTVYDTEFSIADVTDPTKKISFDAGGTTSTSTTLVSTQTANRTLNLPDASDTLVGRDTVDTLNNKTLQFLRQASVDNAVVTGANASIDSVTTGIIRLTNSSLLSLSGISEGASGQTVIIENMTGNTVVINNDEATASSNDRIYTGTNGNVSMRNNATFMFTYDATVNKWMLTGGSGSGSGGSVNFIGNGNAESGTTGWTTYADAAGPRPVDGTGGTANVTFTTSNTNPLSGNESFVLSKPASNCQGQGVSYDFTIDNSSKAKVLKISFDYRVVSGTFNAGSRTTDSDVIAYIYDVTNSRLIEPSTFKLYSNSTTIGDSWSGYFQTSSDSNNYRLILHVASTNASAFSVMFDNFTVSPSQYVYGTPITDWQSYTPTATWSTNVSSITGKYRRVGDSLEGIASVTLSGSNTQGNLRLSLPPGLTVDTSKLITAGGYQEIGTSRVNDANGYGFYSGPAILESNLVAALLHTVVSSYVIGDNVNSTTNKPITFASGDTVTVRFSVPIVGWSSSVQMSDSADTRVISFSGKPNAITLNNTVQTVLYNVSVSDTHGAYNTTTGEYTAPVSGSYLIQASILGNAGASNTGHYLYIQKNTGAGYFTDTQGYSDNRRVTVSKIISLNAGDKIRLAATMTTGSGAIDIGYGELNISRISGPSAIAATETVAARYYKSTSTTLSGLTTIIYDTKVYDTHSAMNTSTGVYTVPTMGLYRVTAKGLGPITTTNDMLSILIRKGTTVQSDDRFYKPSTLNERVSGTSVTTFRANAGDLIDVQMISTPSLTMIGSDTGMWFTIERIGL